MCGIAGVITIKKGDDGALLAAVQRMMDEQISRGPDAYGLKKIHPNIILGHRRLRIIDLSDKANQPMSNSSRNIWIVYNGEIYNFKMLKSELEEEYAFRTNSDTETIIVGYEKWGIEKLLERLRGMFAFALCDLRDNNNPIVYLVRDRLGIKPLYYYYDDDKLIFASEVKAIKSNGLVSFNDVDNAAIVGFMMFGSIPFHRTYLKDVREVMPASYLRFSLSNKISVSQRRYWVLTEEGGTEIGKGMSKDKMIEEALHLFKESVEIHLVSDVPVGIFLSGGIDSSAVTAIASSLLPHAVKTINICFDNKEYDESVYAKLVAKKYGTEHIEVKIDGKHFIQEMSNILKVIDQPSNDGVNTYFISKAAKESGLTVLLSGLGGDELFLGYLYYLSLYKHARYLKLISKIPKYFFKLADSRIMEVRGALRRLSYLKSKDSISIYQVIRGMFSPREIIDLLGITEKEFSDLSREMLQDLPRLDISTEIDNLIDYINELDFNLYMPCQLLRDSDVMGMAHSIEIRVPFLDHLLVEYIRKLAINIKLNLGINKSMLVGMMEGYLPEEVLKRQKRGFIFPFKVWMLEHIKEVCDYLYSINVLEIKHLRNLVVEFRTGRVHWSKLWSCIVLNNFLTNVVNK